MNESHFLEFVEFMHPQKEIKRDLKKKKKAYQWMFQFWTLFPAKTESTVYTVDQRSRTKAIQPAGEFLQLTHTDTALH